MQKSRIIVIVMLCAVIFSALATANMPGFFAHQQRREAAVVDSADNDDDTPLEYELLDSVSMLQLIEDSLLRPQYFGSDTTLMDSLQLAIYKHNKAVDDSLYQDSINRTKKNSIEAPVHYVAKDSLVYDATRKWAFLYGTSNVKYQDMDLSANEIRMNLDSSLVHSTGTADTTGAISGMPIFKMGQDTYESDTMSFNFKTKRGLIKHVYTEQEDGFLNAEQSKRSRDGEIFLKKGTYTTCDAEHPDFYIALTRAKVRPGKEVIFGPAYLVVADVPLPLALPYGFFPFSKSYSSGFIMPSYGDESNRGFYLRDGGYYFAISDKMDLKLLGEIYTKGSWGFSAASNYVKRYKYNGKFYVNYQDTRTGDKGMPDYQKQTSWKVQWNHSQDAKANPFSTFSASVNFATSNFERNNLTSLYNPTSLSQSVRTSSVSWSTNFSSIGMSLSTTANLEQNVRDSSITVKLPDLNINIARFYPFKRKNAVGKERWYEKISMSYTGHLSNSISTKEDKIMNSNIIKDWKNGMQHQIPISGNFTVLKYININPSFNFTDRTYKSKEKKSWDEERGREVTDTLFGFYNVYNWNMSVSASTKLYGFWIPSRKIFGDKIDRLRHVVTPTIGFSYAPDFSASSYGYYDTYQKTNADGTVELVQYSPYQTAMYGVPGKGRTGNINFDIGNNLEMKVKSESDTTGFKKISLIDELALSMSYNMAAERRNWSDLQARIRLKLTKSYTFNLNAVFATYAYELDESGKAYVGDRTEYSYGRFGRFQGMSQNFSYTFNNDTWKKLVAWFNGEKSEETNAKKPGEEDDDDDTGVETNVDENMMKGQRGARKENAGKEATDDDGYMEFTLPWSLTVGYGISMRENTGGKFNSSTMRYPYKFTQTLNFSGNIRISDGWNISFSSGYDFERHDLTTTTASLGRDLHCFNMSCSIVLRPYTSYNFSFRCNAATLTDALKYDKRSSYSNAIQWY